MPFSKINGVSGTYLDYLFCNIWYLISWPEIITFAFLWIELN